MFHFLCDIIKRVPQKNNLTNVNPFDHYFDVTLLVKSKNTEKYIKRNYQLRNSKTWTVLPLLSQHDVLSLLPY